MVRKRDGHAVSKLPAGCSRTPRLRETARTSATRRSGANRRNPVLVAKAAGLPGVRLHDLRHAVATEMARRGVSPTVTSRVLGHASEAFTMSVYEHPDERMLEAAAEALADVFAPAR
jgi:integrase